MKLVPPKKVRIFDYKSFSSSLVLEPKALEITFRIDHLNKEALNEIESVLDWCTTHTEVKSVLFNSKSDNFIKGFNYDDLKNLSSNEINKMFNQLYKINNALICLPQTIVMDLKNGTSNEALVFAIAADIRVANPNAIFEFNQITHGQIDSCGLFSLLKNRINQSVLRTLCLSSIEFSIVELNLLGGHTLANRTSEEIILKISKQSSIARLQTKCALLGLDENKDRDQEFNLKLLNGCLNTEDYKTEKEFFNLRDIKPDIHNQYPSKNKDY